ncbi:MAG: ChaN family lipoprotein [Planctomycetes bacterium]|nr:ChaN family lipoprotein [Planctomycetota bacterium]
MKTSIYDTVGRRDAALDKYYNEYVAEFRNGYDRGSSPEEIVGQLLTCDLAYFGDYHPLRKSQDAILEYLELAAKEGKQIVLALEMLHTEDNEHTEKLVVGEITDKEFQTKVNWHQSWGFPWASFGRYFDFARKHNTPIFGININADGREGDLRYRDKFAATLISSMIQLYPDRLIAVVYGDLHLAGNHLPEKVDKELGRFGKSCTSVIIYQNSETMYWKLVDQELEQVRDIVKIRNRVYNLNNVPPLVKFQSFLTWQSQRAAKMPFELDDEEFELFGETSMLEQVAKYVQTIADFLDIDAGSLNNFELFTAADLDLLDRMVEREVYTKSEMLALKDYIQMAQTAYFERSGVLYIQDYTPSNAAEGAARYLLAHIRPTRDEAVENIDEFYSRVMVEALAFFCSKIVNPSRRASDETNWLELVENFGRRRKMGELQRLDLHVARICLRHIEYETRVLASGKLSGVPRSLFELETDEHVYTTRSLGRRLGMRLFDAVRDEKLDRKVVRDSAFDKTREPDVSRRRYFELLGLVSN